MKVGYWDARLAPRSENDGGAGGGGGGGGESQQQQQQKPAWVTEFGDEFDAEKAYGLISTLRGREKELDKQTKSLAAKVKDYESASLTDQEKLKGQVEELTAKLKDYETREQIAVRRGSVADEARKQGAHNPDDVFALLDPSAMTIDESTGRVTNSTALVNGIKKDKPYLFGAPPRVDAGRRTGNEEQQKQESGMNDGIRGMFGIR